MNLKKFRGEKFRGERFYFKIPNNHCMKCKIQPDIPRKKILSTEIVANITLRKRRKRN